MALQPFEDGFIDGAINVIIGCLVPRIIGDIAVYRVVSGLGYTVFVVMQRLLWSETFSLSVEGDCRESHLQAPLLFRTVIDTSSDNVPPGIDVGQISTEGRTTCCQSQLTMHRVSVAHDAS